MGSWLGGVGRGLKVLIFYTFLPLFLAPSCKPNDGSSIVAALAPPSGFTATAVTTARVDLAWTGVPAVATAIEVERSVNGGAFAPLATVAASLTAYSNTGLTGSTEYCYRVRSVSPGGQGAWSASVCASTVIVSQITPTPDPVNGSPSARMGHSATYDPVGDRMIVFGGLTGAGVTDELWILDFATNAWSQIALSGPAPFPRMGHSATLDPPNNRIIVFGGIDPSTSEYDDTHALDLSTLAWTVPTTSQNPLARCGHSAIYDAVNSRLIVYGGTDAVGAFDDVWEFTTDWNDLTPSTTGSAGFRTGHTAVYDPSGRMIVFGGQDTNPPVGPLLNDVQAFDLTTLTWNLIAASGTPTGRSGHTAILNGSNMMVFGGSTPSASSQMWQLNLGGTPSWMPVILGTPTPGARIGHSAVLRPSTTTMVIFGGGTAVMTPAFPDVWQFGM